MEETKNRASKKGSQSDSNHHISDNAGNSKEQGQSNTGESSILSSKVTPMDVDSNEFSSALSDRVLSTEARSHYHYVPHRKDARESFEQSTRVDNDMSHPHQTPLTFDENCRLGSDKRRYLSSKISRLKHELFNCVMQGISQDDTTEEAKRLTAVTIKLEKAEKAFKLLFGQETTLVPAETPLFQWKGHVFNKNKASFQTVEDCLDQFERVLFAHRLSLEDNWRRLVPVRLSTTMARWYAQHLANGQFGSWSDFRKEVSNKYGKSQDNIKEEAREKLEHLLYDKNQQSFESFIDNFQKLKGQAEITDEDCLIRYLFKALPQELTRTTKFYLNNNADKEKITADFAIGKVIATFEALFKEQWQQKSGPFPRPNRFYEKRSTQQQYQKVHHDKYEKTHTYSKGVVDKATCRYHPGLKNDHTTKDCLLNEADKNKIDKIYKKYGPNAKICYTCKEPNIKKGEHVCPGKTKHVITKKRKTNDNVVPMDVGTTTDAESDSDNEATDSHMTFSALAIEDKQANLIGMNLIMQLGIAISILALDWDDNNNVEIPPIDPDPYVPNNQRY